METKQTVIESVGQWSLVLIEKDRESEREPFAVEGEIRVYGLCQRCQGVAKIESRGNLVDCHCVRSQESSRFTSRFGYEVTIYPARLERSWTDDSYYIKPAEVSLGAIGGVGAEDAKLRAKLLLAGAEVAERFTAAAQQWLIEDVASKAAAK